MIGYPDFLQNLIKHLNKFPGIGEKSAERLALFIVNMNKDQVKDLATSIWQAKQKTKYCKVCGNFSETEICKICSSPYRNKNVICVVAEPKDVLAIEKSGKYNGVYYVLMGTISPLDGINPDDIGIEKLLKKIKDQKVKELIIATNSDTEGETTALYIKKMVSKFDINITRIASGIPMGSQLEYADQATLARALEDRKIF